MADKPNKKKKPLTEKRKRFCELYDICNSAAEAAFQAGFATDKTKARYAGRKLMRDENVRAYIAELREDWYERIGVTKERVLEELALVGFSDLADFAHWNASGVDFKDASQVPEDKRRAIRELKYQFSDGAGHVSIKLHDKISALEKMGKHLGLFKETVEHTGKDGKPIETAGKITVTVKRLTSAKAE